MRNKILRRYVDSLKHCSRCSIKIFINVFGVSVCVSASLSRALLSQMCCRFALERFFVASTARASSATVMIPCLWLASDYNTTSRFAFALFSSYCSRNSLSHVPSHSFTRLLSSPNNFFLFSYSAVVVVLFRIAFCIFKKYCVSFFPLSYCCCCFSAFYMLGFIERVILYPLTLLIWASYFDVSWVDEGQRLFFAPPNDDTYILSVCD